MNKWKIACWICFVTLLVVVGLSGYAILDQGVTITYMKQSYDDTDKDLDTLIEILNQAEVSKEQVIKLLDKHYLSEFIDFSSDTVTLHRVTVIFKEDKLYHITKSW